MQFYGIEENLEQDLLLRRERACELMRQSGADALIATTNVNLFYLTGRIPDGYFYLTREGLCVLFLRRPLNWEGRGIVRVKHPAEIPQYMQKLDLPLPRKLMLEDELPFSEYSRLRGIFGEPETVPCVLRQARAIKTPYERQLLRETGLWHAAAQEGVPGLFRPGMTDIDFEMAIFHHFRTLGHPGFFRIAGHRMEATMGAVFAGDNAAVPSPFDFAMGGAGRDSLPFAACGEALTEGKAVLVDCSGNTCGYLTDLSRTYSIGKLPAQALDMHDTALAIQAAFVAAATPGVRCCDLYNQALDIAARAGFGDSFMGLYQRAKFVGHGLGLEINEPPVIAPKDLTPLAEGMVIALEPKFVLPGCGAVGIENTFLITSRGAERLTPGEDAIVPLG